MSTSSPALQASRGPIWVVPPVFALRFAPWLAWRHLFAWFKWSLFARARPTASSLIKDTSDPNAIPVIVCQYRPLGRTEMDTTSPELHPGPERTVPSPSQQTCGLQAHCSSTEYNPVLGIAPPTVCKRGIKIMTRENTAASVVVLETCVCTAVRGSAEGGNKERFFPPEFRLGTVPGSATCMMSSASWNHIGWLSQ